MVYLLIPWYLKEGIRWDQKREGIHYISSLSTLSSERLWESVLEVGKTMGFDGMGQGLGVRTYQARVFSALMSGLSSVWCVVRVSPYSLRLSVVTFYLQRGGTEDIYTEGPGRL